MGFGALAYDPMTGLAITPEEPDPRAPTVATPQGALSKAVNRLAGMQFGEPRMRTWPENLVRSAATLPGDVLSGDQPMLAPGLRREDYTDAAPAARGSAEGVFGNTLFTPQPWQPNDPAMERAQDLAGMAGGGMMFGRLAQPAVEAAAAAPRAALSKAVEPALEWHPSATLLADSAAPGAPLSALERAAQQGYNIDAYHGTAVPQFDAFKRKPNDIGIHFGTADQANDRISYMAERGRAHVYPVKLKINNPLRVEDLGGWSSENLFYGLGDLRDKARNPLFDKEELRRAAFSAGNEGGRTKALRDLIERKGYDGIVYKNTGETGGSEPYREALNAARAKMDEAFGGRKYSFTPEDQQHPAYQEWRKADDSYDRHRKENAQDSYVAFYPHQVRSQFADFDPKNFKKGGLLLDDAAATGAPLAALEHPAIRQAFHDEMGPEAGQSAYEAYLALPKDEQ